MSFEFYKAGILMDFVILAFLHHLASHCLYRGAARGHAWQQCEKV
jgi:hypothetical protein